MFEVAAQVCLVELTPLTTWGFLTLDVTVLEGLQD